MIHHGSLVQCSQDFFSPIREPLAFLPHRHHYVAHAYAHNTQLINLLVVQSVALSQPWFYIESKVLYDDERRGLKLVQPASAELQIGPAMAVSLSAASVVHRYRFIKPVNQLLCRVSPTISCFNSAQLHGLHFFSVLFLNVTL